MAIALLLLQVSGCRYALLENNLMKDTYKINDVYAVDSKHAWAVGSHGRILFYDGVRWAFQESNTSDTLFGVGASSERDAWAVGSNGIVLHFDGSNWRRQEKITSLDLFDVSVIDPNRLWAVGANGTVLFFDGSRWNLQSAGTRSLLGVAAVSPQCIWAVGDEGAWFYDGEWKMQYDPGFPLQSVTATDQEHAWAVGYRSDSNPIEVSTICSFNGSWSPEKKVPDCALKTVYASGPSNVWVVGSQGTVIHFNGYGWIRRTINQYDYYEGIAAAGGSSIWVVGTEIGAKWVGVPLIRQYNGSWRKEKIAIFDKSR